MEIASTSNNHLLYIMCKPLQSLKIAQSSQDRDLRISKMLFFATFVLFFLRTLD